LMLMLMLMLMPMSMSMSMSMSMPTDTDADAYDDAVTAIDFTFLGGVSTDAKNVVNVQ